MAPSTIPSTRELIQQLAEIEDQMYALRAARAGSRTAAPVDRELVRLARREEQVLARLRHQRVGAH